MPHFGHPAWPGLAQGEGEFDRRREPKKDVGRCRNDPSLAAAEVALLADKAARSTGTPPHPPQARLPVLQPAVLQQLPYTAPAAVILKPLASTAVAHSQLPCSIASGRATTRARPQAPL